MPDHKKTVATPIGAWTAMNKKWCLIRDLWGGTAAMRAAADKWLRRQDREKPADYTARLESSYLFPGYRDSVDKITSKPFGRMVTLTGSEDNQAPIHKRLPEQLRDLEYNTDGDGTSLTELARDLLEIAINHGLVHIWVDYPQVEPGINLADQRKRGIMPRLLPIRPSSLIGWQAAKEDGTDILTQVRIHEVVQEPQGDYDTIDIEQVRVLVAGENEGVWQVWRQVKDKWELHESGTYQPVTDVPIVTGYLARQAFMQGTPVLEDLAWLNVEHWQSASDQRGILRFARSGLIFGKGITEEDRKNQKLLLGPGAVYWATSPDASMEILEHSGNAIEAGAQDLEKIEARMKQLGLQPFYRQSGTTTATETVIDERRTETELQSWIKVIEKLLVDAYGLAAKWVGEELPDDFGVDIYSQFTTDMAAERDLDVLTKARVSGNIDQRTYLTELQRRRVLSEDADVETIVDAVGAEGPSLGGIGEPMNLPNPE